MRKGIIEIIPGRYFAAFYHVPRYTIEDGTDVDVFGAVYTDDDLSKDRLVVGEYRWQVILRFHYYDPERVGPFDNDDHKGLIESEIKGTVASVLHRVRYSLGELIEHYETTLDEILVGSDDVDVVMGVLDRQDWIHDAPLPGTVRH